MAMFVTKTEKILCVAAKGTEIFREGEVHLQRSGYLLVGMIFHCKAFPLAVCRGTHLYTSVKKDNVEVYCLRK